MTDSYSIDNKFISFSFFLKKNTYKKGPRHPFSTKVREWESNWYKKEAGESHFEHIYTHFVVHKKKGSHRSHFNEEQIEYIVRGFILTFLFFFSK